MKKNKVLLIYPNFHGMNMLPPAIALFTRMLRNNGFEVALFDSTQYKMKTDFDSDKEKEKNLAVRPFDLSKQVSFKTTDPFKDLDAMINIFQPDIVGMSATEDTFNLGLTFLKHIDKYDILTVVGGVFATFAPEKVIRNKEIDIVCVGEGEDALLCLCERVRDGIDYSDISNLWIKGLNGKLTKNNVKLVGNLDNNPLVDFSLFEDARFYRPMAGKVYRMLPVETHRGCPYQCTYCNSPAQIRLYREAGAGNFFRKKSLKSVKRELEFYKNICKAEYFYFWADTFFAYTDQEMDDFVEMYKDIGLPFWCQTRPETITEERVSKLRAVGLHRISLGIEHGNEKFREKIINRRLKNETIIKAINIVADCALPAGISVNNIVGFPTETPELAMDTIALNRKIADKVDTMNCYAFVPYHGAPLRELSIKLGYIDEDTSTSCLTGEPVLNMPQFPKEKIKGFMRTFSLYVRFGEDRWKDIAVAEQFTPEGNQTFERLRQEYIEKYFSEDMR